MPGKTHTRKTGLGTMHKTALGTALMLGALSGSLPVTGAVQHHNPGYNRRVLDGAFNILNAQQRKNDAEKATSKWAKANKALNEYVDVLTGDEFVAEAAKDGGAALTSRFKQTLQGLKNKGVPTSRYDEVAKKLEDARIGVMKKAEKLNPAFGIFGTFGGIFVYAMSMWLSDTVSSTTVQFLILLTIVAGAVFAVLIPQRRRMIAVCVIGVVAFLIIELFQSMKESVKS